MDAAAIITASTGLVTAVGAFIVVLRSTKRTERKIDEVAAKTDEVVAKTDENHVLMNSNHDMMLRREEVLIAALQRAGVKIPPNEEIAKQPGTVNT